MPCKVRQKLCSPAPASPDGFTHVHAHHHRARSAKPYFTAYNSFEMRNYEKWVRNSFRIRI